MMPNQIRRPGIHLTSTVAAMMVAVGCAGPGPKLLPAAPMTITSQPDGGASHRYDTNRDGRWDYSERLSPDGRVVFLRFDTNADNVVDLEVDRTVAAAAGEMRHLIILLDSVPFVMVRDLWAQGRFRLFYKPSRVISPFPVMTDLAFSEFFGVSPSRAVEAQFYNGARRNTGVDDYLNQENSKWLRSVDYYLPFLSHASVYMKPEAWVDHELAQIQRRFAQSDASQFIGYVVGTSALGARLGRNGHHTGLVRLDRLCRTIMHRTRGRTHITLLSDHGHDLVRSQRIELTHCLSRCGYRVRNSLTESMDVVVPQFGPVTCAAIYTAVPASVARDVVGIDGVELAAYRDDDDGVVVIGRGERARITRSVAGFRYDPVLGDPLQLRPVLDAFAQNGEMNADGFVDDAQWFAATTDHVYPDAIHRLWRAFHGLVEHTPDVLLSLEENWHWGGATLSSALNLAAAHGNLRTLSSTGFVLTTAGKLPETLRMQDLRAALRELGVPLPEPAAVTINDRVPP